jgi:hypothetical protein
MKAEQEATNNENGWQLNNGDKTTIIKIRARRFPGIRTSNHTQAGVL